MANKGYRKIAEIDGITHMWCGGWIARRPSNSRYPKEEIRTASHNFAGPFVHVRYEKNGKPELWAIIDMDERIKSICDSLRETEAIDQ